VTLMAPPEANTERHRPVGSEHLTIIPLTLPKANAWVKAWHRHHDEIPGGFGWVCLACVTDDGRVCGVAIAGRPTNRNNDDGQTVEVLRVATDGTPNASSALLGACARFARAIGAATCLTYTLDEESGASLRGAGWVKEAEGIKSFWGNTNTRTAAVHRDHFNKSKVRWALRIRTPITVELTPPVSAAHQQPSLFGE
jgi:hypothetical protein